jgi:hypothetical protein
MKKAFFFHTILAVLILTIATNADAVVPSISGLSDVATTEQDPAAVIDSDVSFSGGTNYSGGYLEFALTGGTAEDTLGLVTDGTASATDGQLSIVDGTVYLGNGSVATVIGSVDSTYNGQSGQILRINFSNEFENGNFNTGSNDDTVIPGWTTVLEQISLNGTDQIAGQSTPVDTTWPAANGSIHDEVTWGGSDPNRSVHLEDEFQSGGDLAVRMDTGSISINQSFGVLRGPYMYSDGTVSLQTGDTVSFDWKALSGGDAYDAYGYLIDVRTGDTITILDETGASGGVATAWATKTITIGSGEDGLYRFVFVAGSFDASGGLAVGGELIIDDVVVTQANPPATVTDDHITQVARRVTFADTSDDPPATGRTLTVTARAGDGSTGSATATLTIIPVNDDPPDIVLSNADIGVTGGVNSVVGSLSSADPDSSSLTYSLVAGSGDTDNALFNISGSNLRVNDAASNAPGSYTIRVEVNDGDGGTYEQVLTLTFTDADMDGLSDACEGDADTDGDGTPDYLDTDSDNDGIADTDEARLDTDGDGTPDYIDTDSDNDGIADADEGSGDTDGDGTPDFQDSDSDNDGIADSVEGILDTDNDGTPDFQDIESDGDGVDDDIENGAPNNGDGNGDGIPDRLQSRVTTLLTHDGTAYVTLESPEGTALVDVRAIENPSAEDTPSGSALDYGLFDFTIENVDPGASVQLTVYLPADARPDSYLKYGPTSDDETDHWYEFIYDGVAGAEINDNVITLYFVDGGKGDDDLSADGTVIDAGGPVSNTGGATIDSDDYGPITGSGGCFMGALSTNAPRADISARRTILAAALICLLGLLRTTTVRRKLAITAMAVVLAAAGPATARADETAPGTPMAGSHLYLDAGIGFTYINESIHADYLGDNYALDVDNDIYPLLRLGYAFSPKLAIDLGLRWDVYSGRMATAGAGGSDHLTSYTFSLGPVYTFDEYHCKYLGALKPMVQLNLNYTIPRDDLDYPIVRFDPAFGAGIAVGAVKGNYNLRIGYRHIKLDRDRVLSGVAAASSDDKLNLSGVFFEVAYRFRLPAF